MKKVISVLTATRAEYGLLKSVIDKLNKVSTFDVKIVVTGAHLSPEFGLTYREIEADGFEIDKKIEILLSSDTASAISKSMALAMIGFAEYFEKLKPDLLVVLGDRYETIAVVLVAMNCGIPIAHLHGGETTEGAIDESIRHAITKLSHLHFTSTEVYRNRVIQLGEQPERVFNVGAIGAENALNEELMSKEMLANSLNVDLTKPYAVVTFHPVTLERGSAIKQITALLEVCKKNKTLNFIFTLANADAEGRIINQNIKQYAEQNNNIFEFSSLGRKRYLSALKYCEMVIGNSSSGIIEAPSFAIPTINIGDRQKGRVQTSSVINCDPTELSIQAAIDKAQDELFKQELITTVNPYIQENTSQKICDVIKEYLMHKRIKLKKSFYDCEVTK